MTKNELLQVIKEAARDKTVDLDLSGNALTELPPELAELTSLTKLDLSHNELRVLPSEVVRLTKLTWLDVSENRLTSLQPEIGQLTNLTKLFIGGNQLSELPLEISALINLETLVLWMNQLTSLPKAIGQMADLRGLNLSGNRLTTLPREIGDLFNLKVLDLSRNQLIALPPEIERLTNLRYLDLTGNSLLIPFEIVMKRREPSTIVNYYLQHLTGRKRSLNEAKLLLVGQGNVGKTSLVRRLVESGFDPQENKTEGIDIRRWKIVTNQQTIQLNVWDFGGQEIMHATHQFFLTKRSLYLLVLDARLDEDENRVEYWLRMIQSFGGDSPVIVVGNKIDQQPLDLDKRGLRAKYPQIAEVVETSCETGDGIDKLKAVIAREVGVLKHIHDQLLLTWFAIKTKLEQMEQDYIPYAEYEKICQTEAVTDETSQRTLIGFLHDLGVVLNFQDDPRLEDTNILNPEWVTNSVYRILNYPALQSNGVLERRQLGQILPARQYPRDKHLFIMDMIRKFDLCFDFEAQKDEKWLIPDLLPKEEPNTGDWSSALAFQYHYNVLPGSVISRFIVRMHPYIHQNTYWRNGVVLAREGNEALVKADREDRKIYIRVRGPEKTRRALLAIIRWQFDAIHQTIPGLEVVEKVPMPDHPQIEPVDYGYLRDLEGMGESAFIPPGLRQRVSVRQLLDGVDEPKQDQRVALHEILTKRFDDEELRDLCFKLNVEYQDLPGGGRSGKARELVILLERQDRLAELVKLGKKLRPEISWTELVGSLASRNDAANRHSALHSSRRHRLDGNRAVARRRGRAARHHRADAHEPHAADLPLTAD